jgi:hypothetical protein
MTPSIPVSPWPYADATIAIAQTVETCVKERSAYLGMMSAEQRSLAIDLDLKGQKLAYDLFLQPLSDLAALIRKQIGTANTAA